MQNGFLLSRVLLHFGESSDDLLEDLSAAAMTPDGSLWVGSDELLSVERLSPLDPCVFGDRQSFFLGDFVELFNTDDEIDIEGMDYHDGYLWLTGSHSTKRGKAKGKKPQKDIRRLSEIKTDDNRYLLARVPVVDGVPLKSYCDPHSDRALSAAALAKFGKTNILEAALRDDPHLGPFLQAAIPSKDNGLDIEGLAVWGERVFLGLRGPVLRGWAIVLELHPFASDDKPGTLELKAIGPNGEPYRKHFLDLDGLGVRELAVWGDRLLVLAGPTLDHDGALRVFCLSDFLETEEERVISQGDGLRTMFDFPYAVGCDRAEGLALFSCLEEEALLAVYDSPHESRRVGKSAILVDAYRLREP